MTAGGVKVFHFSKGEDWSYRIDGSNVTERDDGWDSMVNDEPNTYWAQNLPSRNERSMNFGGEELEIIYHGKCFEPRNLRSMEVFENELLEIAQEAGICELDTNSTCRKMKSVLRLFDGTYEGAIGADLKQVLSENDATDKMQPTFRLDQNFDRVREITRAAFENDGHVDKSTDVKVLLEYSVGKEKFNEYYLEDETYCRSKFFSGAPMQGYRNVRDRFPEQQKKMRELHNSKLKSYLESHDRVGDLEVYYSSKGLSDEAFSLAHRDSFFFVIGSALVVIIGVMALTRSIFLGCMLLLAQFGIFMWTNLVYRYMFGYQWLGIPQQLSLFAVFAVSLVQFLFLLHEFKSAHEQPTLKQRLPLAVRQANKSVISSGLLGAVAYLSHCFSKIVVVESTGLFLGLAVLISLLTYLVFYPAVIAFWFKYFRGHKDDDGVWVGGEKTPVSTAVFNGAIGHHTARWFIAAGMFIAMATFIIISVKQMGLHKEQPLMWRAETNFGSFERASRDRFRHSESGHQATVRIIWGLDHLDTERCHKSDPNCLGRPIYDNLFDLSWHEPQNELVRFCDDLKNLDGQIVNDLKIQRKTTGPYSRAQERPTEIKCFMTDMRDFYEKADSEKRYDKIRNTSRTTTPFLYDSMSAVMETNTDLFDMEAYRSCAFFPPYANDQNTPSCRNCDSYYRHFETGVMNWVANDGDNSLPPTHLETYVGLMGGVADATMEFNVDNGNTMLYAGDYGGFLRYMTVEVNLTISSLDEDHNEAIQVMENWDKYVRDTTTNLSKPLQHAYQTTPEDRTWAWLQMQKILIDEAIQGLILSIVLFGIFMTLSVNNYTIGILATLAVGSVPVALVGMFTACQWNMGLPQVVLLVMPVGMASDFISHYAIWYACPTPGKLFSRTDKARYAFQRGAFAVFGGGSLMFAASLFLLGSKLEFVFSFGVALSFTLGMASLVGMFLFLILLGIVGPEGKEGAIFTCWGANKVSTLKEKSEGDSIIVASESSATDPLAGGLLPPSALLPPTARASDPLANLLSPPNPPKDGNGADSDSASASASDSDSDSDGDGDAGGGKKAPTPPGRLPSLVNPLAAMPPLGPPKSATPSLPPLIQPTNAN